MKAFDPIAAGFTPRLSRVVPGLFYKPDGKGNDLYLDCLEPDWKFIGRRDDEPVLLYIPASFDHNTAVALLRANGADIPEPDHAD